jgi:hypothetical protein
MSIKCDRLELNYAIYGICDIFRCDRPYENMNITGVKGLTDVEISTLKA